MYTLQLPSDLVANTIQELFFHSVKQSLGDGLSCLLYVASEHKRARGGKCINFIISSNDMNNDGYIDIVRLSTSGRLSVIVQKPSIVCIFLLFIHTYLLCSNICQNYYILTNLTGFRGCDKYYITKHQLRINHWSIIDFKFSGFIYFLSLSSDILFGT